MQGVSRNVEEAMSAVGANVLTEDNLLLKTCAHGVRHPVGHLRELRFDPTNEMTLKRHEAHGPSNLPKWVKCDGCCEAGAAMLAAEAEAARLKAETEGVA